jgi:prefoldin subunit 5
MAMSYTRLKHDLAYYEDELEILQRNHPRQTALISETKKLIKVLQTLVRMH